MKNMTLLSLQARYDAQTNPEPIIICSGPNKSWTNPEPILNQYFHWFVWPPFGYGSCTYVRIRSHIGSTEPILNQKYLQGWYDLQTDPVFLLPRGQQYYIKRSLTSIQPIKLFLTHVFMMFSSHFFMNVTPLVIHVIYHKKFQWSKKES